LINQKIRNLVLMADDDEDDCFLAKEAFGECGVEAAFSCVGDGVELMGYLFEQCRPEPKRLPNLILLDLNMPQKNGRQALLEIKATPLLRGIPVIIFTTSEEEKDISFTMSAGAELFMTKPASFDEWVNIMKTLAARWLS
jgi:CheY-like chemotaxis protein